MTVKTLTRTSPKLPKTRQGKDFKKRIREAYRKGIVRYLLERGFEFDAALSYRQGGMATDMTGGGFFRSSKNPAKLRLGAFIALLEQQAINLEVFLKTIGDLRNRREQYRAIGVAAAVAMVAKELNCIPSWTDQEEPCCLEDDGALNYSYLSLIPKEQWPTSVENARFITISSELAEEVCQRTIELTPEAISPAEVAVADDKIALIENVVRGWAYPGTYVMEAMAQVWAIPGPEERLLKLAKGKRSRYSDG